MNLLLQTYSGFAKKLLLKVGAAQTIFDPTLNRQLVNKWRKVLFLSSQCLHTLKSPAASKFQCDCRGQKKDGK